MRRAPGADREIGMGYYVSDTDGIGGRLRDTPEDFRVSEVEAVDPAPLDASPGDYPHLLVRVRLRDWDTNAFVRELSGRLGASRERISWAGTKDKRAITTQLFSIERCEPEEVPSVPGADIEAIGRLGRRLLFGDLAGNSFEVTVREPDRPELAADITADLRSFGGDTPGVPNYFGPQRFGSIRPITHEVGRHIVRGDWEAALLSYVGNPHPDEPAATREARRFVEESRDWQAGIDRFPAHLHHERALLHALASADGDEEDPFRAALETLPWNLQRLFVNAVQSFAFNRMVSERLARGIPFDRAVAGDRICFTEEVGGIRVPDPGRVSRVTADRLATANRHIDRGRAFVTAPLVGTDSDLAEGAPGDIEREVLDELELTPNAFDLPGAFESTGTRRAILVTTAIDVANDPLCLSFTLPRGSYATVLLREYLKTATG